MSGISIGDGLSLGNELTKGEGLSSGDGLIYSDSNAPPPVPMPHGVFFDGASGLDNPAFALGTDVTQFSIFLWVQPTPDFSHQILLTQGGGVDFLTLDFTAPGQWRLDVTMATNDGSDGVVWAADADSAVYANWTPILISFDFTDSGNPKGAIYVTDALTAGTYSDSSTGPLSGDGLEWFVGTLLSAALNANLSTFWFAPISLLDGTGLAIPDVTRRLFTTSDGKWVDPAGFPSGALILFDGDAATYGNNQGAGGAFTGVGDPITDAATNPNEPQVSTWSELYINSNVELSNDNLTATSGAGDGQHYSGLCSPAFPVAPITAGMKRYWETDISSNTDGGEDAAGLGNLGTDTGDDKYLGEDNNSMGVYTGGHIYYGNNVVGDLGAAGAALTRCIALDTTVTPAQVYMRFDNGDWNGSPTADPETGTGGLDMLVTGEIYGAYTVLINSMTLNISGPFSFPVPAGYNV